MNPNYILKEWEIQEQDLIPKYWDGWKIENIWKDYFTQNLGLHETG